MEDDRGLAVLLCPHSFISETQLKVPGLFFKPVVVGRPWYMEPPASHWADGDFGEVRFIDPPEVYKPDEGFKKQIADYKQWAMQNRDPGSNAYLRFGNRPENNEETSRAIGQKLREGQPFQPTETQNKALQWHLVLHLAREIECQQAEAEGILVKIKAKESPLKDLMEEETGFELFKDLPPFRSETAITEKLWGQILLAWCGLFANHLAEYPILLTNQQPVWDIICKLWEPLNRPEKPAEVTLEFPLPDVEKYSLASLTEFKKTYLESEQLQAFKKALLVFGEKPKESQAELVRVGQAIAKVWPLDLKTRKYRLAIKTLAPFPEAEHFRSGDLWTKLFNKTFVFISNYALSV
jgi:hypothetical protein